MVAMVITKEYTWFESEMLYHNDPILTINTNTHALTGIHSVTRLITMLL